MRLSGYQSTQYANSLSEFGEILYVGPGVYLQKRPILGTEYYDLVSLYPLFSPPEFNSSVYYGIEDFVSLDKNCVSLTLITDPLLSITPMLKKFFDYSKVYKTHYIVDLTQPLNIAHAHWDRIRSFAKTGYEIKMPILNPTVNSVDVGRHFYDLYKVLIEKHGIEGIAQFSENSFIKQLNVPGLVMMECSKDNKAPEVVRSFLLQTNYSTGEKVAYFHLGASSDKGYYLNGSHAIHYQAIIYFKQLGIDKLVLGGTPDSKNAEGLKLFKSGFSNTTKDNYILGKVLNQRVYDELSKGKTGDYFPLYNSKELILV